MSELDFIDPFIKTDSYLPNGVESERYDGNLVDILGGGLLRNRNTGLGTSADSVSGNFISGVRVLSEFELRALYRSNWVIGKIIDLPPNDMVKAGFDLTITEGDFDDVSIILNRYKNISMKSASPFDEVETADDAFKNAYRWARLFGQAYIVVRVNNGEDLEQPLTQVRSIEGLTVLDRYALIPEQEYNALNSEYFRLTSYDTRRELALNQRIHRSRVLIFSGNEIPDVDRLSNGGNHDSIIQKMWEVFNRHYSVKGSVTKAINSFSMMAIAISNLTGLISSGKKKHVSNHIQEVNTAMSMFGIMPIDASIEKPFLMDRRFAGLSENVQQVIDEFTAATGLPFYKIWGTIGKSALSDSGHSEEQAYNDLIHNLQKNKFYKNHIRLLKMIFSLEIGYIPEDWDIEYKPIEKENPKIKSDTENTKSKTFMNLKSMGVITAEEIAVAVSSRQPIESVIDIDKFDENGELPIPEGELEDDDESITNGNDDEPDDEDAEEDEIKNDVIVHSGNKWLVMSKDRKKTFGSHKTKEAAIAQLAAIEIRKIKNKKRTDSEIKLDNSEPLKITEQVLDDQEWQNLAYVTPQDRDDQLTNMLEF